MTVTNARTAEPAARGYMPPASSTDWATPQDLFDALQLEFGPFDLDPCGSPALHYATHVIAELGEGGYYDGSEPAADGLTQPWYGRVFMNPPYGRGIGPWIAKARAEVEAARAALVCALLPVRTDTRWWQEHIMREAGASAVTRLAARIAAPPSLALVRFLPYMGDDEPLYPTSRLKFGGPSNRAPAPFPSAIVVWRGTGW